MTDVELGRRRLGRRPTSSSPSPTGPPTRDPAVAGRAAREGLYADTDYAGRSLKGQLTQAGRLGARATLVVEPDGQVLRRRGEADVPVGSLAELDGAAGMSWRDLMCGEVGPEHVGQRLDAGRLGRHAPRPRRARRSSTCATRAGSASSSSTRSERRSRRRRAQHPQRVRPPRRGRGRQARRPRTSTPTCRPARSSSRSTSSRSSRGARHCRSSSTRRGWTRRCACATAGSTCAGRGCSATSGCAPAWSRRSGA